MRIIKTRILIETEELIWGKFPQIFVEEFCEKCGKYVRMTNLMHAAQIVGRDEKTLDVWTTSGKIHTAFSSRQEPMLCLVSLLLN